MVWEWIGRATVWLILFFLAVCAFRIAEMAVGDESLRGFYRAVVQASVGGFLGWLILCERKAPAQAGE